MLTLFDFPLVVIFCVKWVITTRFILFYSVICKHKVDCRNTWFTCGTHSKVLSRENSLHRRLYRFPVWLGLYSALHGPVVMEVLCKHFIYTGSHVWLNNNLNQSFALVLWMQKVDPSAFLLQLSRSVCTNIQMVIYSRSLFCACIFKTLNRVVVFKDWAVLPMLPCPSWMLGR